MCWIATSPTVRDANATKHHLGFQSTAPTTSKLRNPCFLANLGALVCASMLFAFLVIQVSKDSELARFDPYKILDIDRSASDKQIKYSLRGAPHPLLTLAAIETNLSS